MAHPQNTYRIQFHQNFTLSDLDQISAYLQKLGVHTIYASPLLAATPGSTHGYDGISSHQINPEIGSKSELIQLKKKLKEHKMQWLQDIVPNHMAFHPENSWLMHLLEYGVDSPYRSYFDTSFSSDLMQGKMMIPVLGKSLRQACEAEELSIQFDKGKFSIHYFDQYLPIAPSSYAFLLQTLLLNFEQKEELSSIIQQLQQGFADDELTHKASYQALAKLFASAKRRSLLQRHLAHFSLDTDALTALVELQHYRLCHWQETDQQINFRRFFTVNGLICMNVDQPAVFEDTHLLIKEMVEQDIFDGLRIDHIDGLYNPTKYLRDLRHLCGSETYIVAEKILETGEKLPEDWPIQGATGYEFLAWCNNVLTDKKSKETLTEYYRELTGVRDDVHALQLQKKAAILENHMGGEVANLYHYLMYLELLPKQKSYDAQDMKEAIKAFLVYFPVYRLYDESFPLAEASYRVMTDVFNRIIQDKYASKKAIRAFAAIFENAQFTKDDRLRKHTMLFFARCMQFTGPVMAKGVEDTLMYTYHRHIGRHEVGDHPENFGLSKKAFHQAMADRQEKWPAALNGSATHDTKRGEDQRARLQVLSTIPEIWIEQVKSWEKEIQHHYGQSLPHANDRYFLYQTLFGSYPMPNTPYDAYDTRLHAYLEKYLREGKERSDWATPNEKYETCYTSFATYLLDEKQPFFPSFYAFLSKYIDFGICNSLNQLVLKLTCPGIPDVYQGSELWELGFVDPDNRRPVDYALRQTYLAEVAASTIQQQIPSLWAERHAGKIKLALLHDLLQIRAEHTQLFNDGTYVPIKVEGKYKRHILAYARRYQQEWAIVVLPLHLASIANHVHDALPAFDWGDTQIILPKDVSIKWKHAWASASGSEREITINTLFTDAPIALLRATSTTNKRSAGIVLHITSLPSEYGIGDLGDAAYNFADKLQAAKQRWWQVLPLGPTAKDQFHSPYSTWSAMAGSPLLIDLTQLGITPKHSKIRQAPTKKGKQDQVDFDAAVALKLPLLRAAFDQINGHYSSDFQRFCKAESKWLNDYALYVTLREKQGDLPWYSWEVAYRLREPEALKSFSEQHKTAILFQKWLQYTFDKQWSKLRSYCHARNISILGDIPIYVSYDSADVWANPSLFALNDDGTMKAVAGVPPDYFNADGQLWGMPVFNWEAHKKSGYSWWLTRIARNIALYDMVRLDHFRAFSAYWEVPATAESAQVGTWKKAPGKALFAKIKHTFGLLPFIAEDLGDIDEDVYALRDSQHMPGMKVLQFAFGEDIATSPHIPHQHQENFVVYTGTHDNNTSRGWYEAETDKVSRKNLRLYAGYHVDVDTINATMLRLAYSSRAAIAMVPMQDILDLDAHARMNTPATTAGNWTWQMQSEDDFDLTRIKALKKTVMIFNRG